MVQAAFFGYSLRSVLRARRRSLLVIVGLSLAVAIVATPAIAVDSEVRVLVDRLVATIPYDYQAAGTSPEIGNVTAAVAGVDGVVGAEPVVSPPPGTLFLESPADRTNLTPTGIAFVRSSFAAYADRFGFRGSFDLAPTQIAIADRIAGRYGLAVGDPMTLWNVAVVCPSASACHPENFTANLTVASILVTPLATGGSTNLGQPLGQVPGQDLVFASLAGVADLRASLHLAVADPPFVRILVWADRSRLVDPYDPVETAARVLHLQRELIAALAARGLTVTQAASPDTGARLSDVVRTVNDATAFQRGLLVLLSIPAAALAFLFSRMSFEIGLAKRRREIGTLRSRGTSVGLVLSGLLVEALVLGAVAAAAGFAIAVGLSRIFLGFVNASFPGGTAIPFGEVAVSATAVLITVLAAVAVAFLVAYAPVRRASGVRIVYALKTTSPIETSVEFQEARGFLLIALGMAVLLLVVGLLGSTGRGGLLTFLFGAVLAVLIVFAPVLLILGVARYITLGTNRPYRVLARLVRPWLGEMDFLVVEGLRRNPRRSSNLAVLVAFGLAFAMFVVSLAGMVDAHEVRVAQTTVGGDLFFETMSATHEELENVSGQAGFAAAAVVDFVPSNYGTLIAINASEYLRTVPGLDAYYFTEGAPSVLADLAQASGAVANVAAAKNLGLHIGDPLVLNVFSGGRTGYLYTVVVTVAAVVSALPGLQRSGGAADIGSAIVVDVRTLNAFGLLSYPLASPGERLIVKAATGADPRALAKSLQDRWSGTAVLYEDVIASMRADPFRASLFGQLYTQAGLSALVAILAVSAMAYASGVEREAEYATIVARGLDRRRLAVLLFGEGIAVGIIGALPAVPMVLIILWAFLRVSAVLAPLSLPMEFLIPASAWILLAATLGAVALGSLIAGIRLRWMNIPAVLKLRGA